MTLQGTHRQLLWQRRPRRWDPIDGRLAPDGTTVYVSLTDEHGHYRVDRLSLQQRMETRLRLSDIPTTALVVVEPSPNGRTLAVQTDRLLPRGGAIDHLGFVSAAGGRVRFVHDRWSADRRIGDSRGLFGNDWSPDGRRVLSTYETPAGDHGLVFVNPSTLSVKAISGGKGLIAGPAHRN